MRTLLLGPQRFIPTATAALRSLEVEGPVATVNAGWEEREDTVEELDAALDHRGRHLRLFHRLGDVLAKDPVFADAAMAFRDRHDELQALYRLRLGHALDAAYAVQRRVPDGPETKASVLEVSPTYDALSDAIEEVRRLDAWYLGRLTAMYEELDDVGRLRESGVLGWHRNEIAHLIADCAVVVLTGGHVGTLVRAVRLFDVAIPPETPVIAWSAGAMALTSRVVLFHDFGPQGASEAEINARGLGRLPGIVAFPHAKTRLKLTEPRRCAILARRFSERTCLLLDDASWVEIGSDGVVPSTARILTRDGAVRANGDRAT